MKIESVIFLNSSKKEMPSNQSQISDLFRESKKNDYIAARPSSFTVTFSAAAQATPPPHLRCVPLFKLLSMYSPDLFPYPSSSL